MRDDHIGGEIGGDGVFGPVGRLDGVQQGVQALPVGGCADKRAVHLEHIALHHRADLVEEIGLKFAGVGKLTALGQGKGIAHRAGDLIIIAQNGGGPGLHPVHHILEDLGIGHGAQGHPVHRHYVAGRVNGGHHSGHAHHGGHRQKIQRCEEPFSPCRGLVQLVLEPPGAQPHAGHAVHPGGTVTLQPFCQGQACLLCVLVPGRMQNIVHMGIPPVRVVYIKIDPAQKRRIVTS